MYNGRWFKTKNTSELEYTEKEFGHSSGSMEDSDCLSDRASFLLEGSMMLGKITACFVNIVCLRFVSLFCSCLDRTLPVSSNVWLIQFDSKAGVRLFSEAVGRRI